jgi:hypothetical protein
VDAGADPTAKNTNGKTPVDVACDKKSFSIASRIEQFYQPSTKSANFNV